MWETIKKSGMFILNTVKSNCGETIFKLTSFSTNLEVFGKDVWYTSKVSYTYISERTQWLYCLSPILCFIKWMYLKTNEGATRKSHILNSVKLYVAKIFQLTSGFHYVKIV